MQVFEHTVDWVGIVVNRSPVVSTVPVVLDMNVSKGLDLTWLLTRSSHDSVKGHDDQVVWQNLIHACELHRSTAKGGGGLLTAKTEFAVATKTRISLPPPAWGLEDATRVHYRGGALEK